MEDLKEACVPSLVFTERKGEGQRKGGMEQRKIKRWDTGQKEMKRRRWKSRAIREVKRDHVDCI